MLKKDMTCEKCIYHAEIGDNKFSVNNVVCRRTETTKTKARESWCGLGIWQVWRESQGVDDIPSQWSEFAWGEFEPTEEERRG